MKLTFGLILLTIASFAKPHFKEHQLEYKFVVGDEYACVQITKQSVSQNLLGIEKITETAMSGSLQLKVVSLTSNGAKLEVQYTTLVMIMKMPDMPALSFDADGSQEKIENQAMRSMMNKPFFITLSKQGVVEDIQGEENLWSGFMGLGLDANQLVNIKQQFDQTFGKASIKSSFEMALINYSDKKVLAGMTWTNKTGLGMNLPLETINTWRILSIDKEIINISSEGTVTTLNKDQFTDNPNGVKSKIDLSGTQKILSTANANTGWPIETKINSEIKGNMIFHSDQIETDLEVPMEIITESNYKFIKKK
jgi:hypothetical protein